MQVEIPIEWLLGLGVGLGLSVLFLFIGIWIGVRIERNKWMNFLTEQCQRSLTTQPVDPVQAMMDERTRARDRRLDRKGEER